MIFDIITNYFQYYYITNLNLLNMICNTVYNYCCEDVSKIENYEKAIADDTQTWDCHHKLETDLGLLRKQLIDDCLYYNRPANELIFLTPKDHAQLHLCGKKRSEKINEKISNSLKGIIPWNKDKKCPQLSLKLKGKFKGKHWKKIDGKRVWY